MTKQELHELMRQLDEEYFLPDEWWRSRVIFSEADGEEAQWREIFAPKRTQPVL